MAASWKADPELMDLEEEELWEMINRHRCKIVSRLHPERLTPYLRQIKVLDSLDEEEILHSVRLSTRPMRQGYLLDLLRTRGKNGAVAFLESLLLVNPKMYTLITGKEASIAPNSFSRLIDSGQLNVFLLSSMSSLHEELTKEKQLKDSLLYHLRKLWDRFKQLETECKSLRNMETENHRLHKEMDEQSQALSKLKDVQYDLSMSYSLALQEKDTMQTRSSELQEQVYAMKEELHRVRIELQAAQNWSTTTLCEEELFMLRKENQKLREMLEIKEQDKLLQLGEMQQADLTPENAQKLLNQLICAREKIASSEALEKTWQEEKETILKEKCHLQTDNDILKKKADAFHHQVSELQKERDQAYQARDMVQAEISSFLAEKDGLRQQVMELTDSNSKLRLQIRSLEEQLQTQRMRRNCMDTEQREKCLKFKHQRLVRMDAICPSEEADRISNCSIEPWQINNDTCSSLGENILPCSTPIQEGYQSAFTKSCSTNLPDLLQCEVADLDCESEMEYKKDLQMFSNMESGESTEEKGLSMPRRRHAQRMNTRTTIIAFQGDDLLKQICIIGGNKTGIFIHQVTKDSAADEMSLVPGCQIMAVDFDVMNPSHRVDLEGMTSEDAHWTLNRVNGFCCLSIRCNMDEYRKLLNDIDSGSAVSGDSFYVRVNQSMPGRLGGGMQVTCGEILHIKDTMYKGRQQWYAHRVNPYTMNDGESGSIPNYRQAQEHLISSIQTITWQNAVHRKSKKQVRIVSTDRCTSHLLWTSIDCGLCRCEDSSTSSALTRSCFTLMPYTLVTQIKVTLPRPVLVVPSLLGRHLSEKLCATKDFMKCDTECLTDAEYAAKYQRGDVIGEKEGERSCFTRHTVSCFTRHTVESVAQQNTHCLLELGLSCLAPLIRVGIYPIVLHVPLTEKSIKKLKKPLHWWRNWEDLLLECAQREETELDALPCFYRTVEPETWNDTESLLSSVKEVIMDEQKRFVWLENKLC
ncbi:caspase recruitment domain-containing protein 14 [Pelobates fuscus]|uniref:caspase recruitment domain-containing protein 14 n=1 Tax=Pelobates fuscus TaxID=191477 RepID=UPI002FE4E033